MPYADLARQRAYQLEWMLKRRREWVEANGPCRICGSAEELEVDHRDPATKVSHRVWSWSRARRDAELEKCQVLCGRCHTRKTQNELRVDEIPHGTHTGYSRHRCRCPRCTTAHAVYNRNQRAVQSAKLRQRDLNP